MSYALHPAQIALMQQHHAMPTLARVALVVSVALTNWDRRRQTRRILAALDTHELFDIGLTRHAALAEAAKPFWRA